MKQRRILAFVLVLAMLLSTVPVQVLADVSGDELQVEERLNADASQDDSREAEQIEEAGSAENESQTGRQLDAKGVQEDNLTEEQLGANLKAAVDENEYPGGLFEFLTTRMNTSENLPYVEFAIVRKGGTTGPASVTLKAIDVTAKYGEDYTLSVAKGNISETLPGNEDAMPLIESVSNSDEDSLAGEEDENSDSQQDTATINVNDGTGTGSDEEYETLTGPTLEEGSESGGLRGARDAAIGKESTRKNWREISQTEKESALKSNKEMYEEVPGVTCTLHFADGEYIKKIRFNTIDDKISEDEEQVLFALLHPQGGVTGDSVNAFMNIEDNEEKETVRFEMQDSEVQADCSLGYAEVKVKRTAGLYRYGLINVGTAALSAQPEVDYEPVRTELHFIPGQETQTVKVPLLSGNSGAGLQFYIKLDPDSPNLSQDGSTQTLVTIKPSTRNQMQASSTVTAMAASDDIDPLSASSNISPLSSMANQAYSSDNYRVRTLTINNITGSYNYWQSGSCAYVPISGQNQSNYIYFDADLTMVQKIKYNWSNPCEGKYQGRGWIYPAYYQSFYSQMKIRGDVKTSYTKKFSARWDEYTLTDADRQPTSIYFTTGTYGDARNSDLYVGNVELYYIPINVCLKTLVDDSDANIVPKTWTATGTSADEKKVYVGGLAFANDAAADEKTFYDGDTVYLAPKFASSSLDTSKVYLWGYKIEKVGGGYYYVRGDSLNIRDAYSGALQDKDGKYIPRNQILMDHNQIVLLPVFKARNAFVKINFNPDKGGIANNSFSNGEILKIGMLDTVKYNAYAQSGYYVSGYDHININYDGCTVTSNEMERTMESWSKEMGDTTVGTYFGSYNYLKKAEPVANIAINTAVPNELDFKPQKNFTNLTVQYSIPFLTVKVDPKSGSKDKGAVAYFPKNGDPQTGNSTTPLVISPIERNKAYMLSGDPDEGYRMLWKDWSGDTNGDGVIDQSEYNNIKEYESLFERKAVAGDFYNYVANYDKPLIYYSFEPKPTGGDPGLVTGKVILTGGNVLNNTGTAGATDISKPLAGVSVIINGHDLETNEKGIFSLQHEDFTSNEYQTLVINYRGINYTGYVNVNCFTRIEIREYDSFIPYNFTAFEQDAKLDFRSIGNKDAEYTFRFDVKTIKPGLSANKALIRIYSKEGVQRGTPIEVEPVAGTFIFTLNPATAGVVPGDTMTLQIVDQNEVAHLEHNIGFSFKKYLSTFSLLTSFKSPASGVIDMVGSIDTAFDLGLAGQADNYMKKNNEEWVIAFGFNKDWEKSLYDSSENEAEADSGQESAETELKNAAKSTDAAKAKDVVGDAVDETNKEKKSAKLTADMNFGLSTSLYLRMIVDNDPDSEHYGDAYFNEMILTAKVSGSFSTKVEIQTPVGVTVFVGLEMGGDVTAMMVVEQYDYKKFYFNDSGEIDFSKAGDSDPNRDFTIYGKFMINPYIKIMVGAEIPLATITINGKAAFDMNFTTTGSGSGSVTLTSDMTLKVACFEFNWQIAQKTWDLFSYGQLRSFNANQLFSDQSYLYNSAEDRNIISRDYLENRGEWQGGSGSGQLKALTLNSAGGNEKVLQTGVYPYPYTLLADIGENQQLLVFLDDDVTHDDKNRTQLYYSINSGNVWSAPQQVDDDDTPDTLPSVYDMGDKVLVAWSSANTKVDDNDTTMEVLNNSNIKARFFDKNNQTFGEVQDVTYQTQEDIYSDSNPYIAYWKDETNQENLMIVYTKSEYRASASEEEQDAVVGDIINPYYTTLAYRFYDFANDQWEESENMDGYYGQNFIDASAYAEVDESGLVIDESKDPAGVGYWSRVPTQSEVSIKSFENNDPLIVDSDAIGYENYAVLAYSMDLDSDTGTTGDRELYIQLYDFAKKVFFPPIRCTDDDEGLSNLIFDQSNDNVYLYYLSGGDIHCIDVGYLINQNLLYYVVPGTNGVDQGVFVVNKLENLYRKPEVVVKHKYDIRTDADGNQVKENDMPIDEFMVASDENNVYIVWGENDMTYKDGVDPNSAEAARPENNYREHQIYAAQQTIGATTETQLYEEDGVTPATYPAADKDGKPIDYSQFVDINNQVGKVQAGDPIIKKYRPTQWSEQVKLTDERGANFNDLDFVILPDGRLRVVFVKGMSAVMNVAGEAMAVENVNNRTLMTADFDISTEKAEVSMEAMDMPQPQEVKPVSINLQNLGLASLKNIKVELVQTVNNEDTIVDEQEIAQLRGGEKTRLAMSWQALEDLSDIKLSAIVKRDGEVLCTAVKDIEAASAVEVSEVKTEHVGRNSLKISGFATNNGNIAAHDAVVYAEAGGSKIGSVSLGDLDVGETRLFEFDGDLQAVQFESAVGEDGSVTDSVKLSVHADGTGQSLACERYASADDLAFMNNISSFGFKNGDNTIADSITLNRGSSTSILPVIEYVNQEMGTTPRLEYFSSQKDVADFTQDNETLSAKSIGTTTITAYMLPPRNNLTLSEDNLYWEENLDTIADEAVKIKSFTVNVISSTGGHSPSSTAGGTPTQTSGVDTNTAGNIVTAAMTAPIKSDSNGKVTAAVSAEQIKDSVNKAIEKAASQNEKTSAGIRINVAAPEDTTAVEVSLPKDGLGFVREDGIAALSISTPVGSLEFDSEALATLGEAKEDVKISAARVEAATLSPAAQQVVGDRPVFDFSVTSGGETISTFAGKVTVSVPYTLKDGEDTEAIVIYYINAAGEPVMVSNCAYDSASGTVTFKTDHFSTYAVGYNKLFFDDVADDAWYSQAVSFAAARGITTGAGNNLFKPDAALTRAQFMVMVMRANNIPPVDSTKDNFADAGSDYYTGYLAAAKKLGISKGVGDNLFAPDRQITRQEMCTLLYNALQMLNEQPAGTAGKALEDFRDADRIAPWATEAMTWLVEAGMINGSDGELLPADVVSRAQMVQIMYNLMKN